MKLRSCEQPIYQNYVVLSPDGEPMFRCGWKKLNFYINNDLAEWVDEQTIQLTFEPKGKGYVNDPFHLQDRRCECVVCGAKEDLTRHHVVPSMYRRHMPNALIAGDCHDILPMCESCHFSYERKADDLKKQIAEETGIPLHNPDQDEKSAKVRAWKIASSLIRYHDRIPHESQKDMIWRLAHYLGHVPSYDDIKRLSEEFANKPRRGSVQNTHGKRVVENMSEDDIFALVIRWRRHFLEHTDPQFMPDHWDVERRYKDTNAKVEV